MAGRSLGRTWRAVIGNAAVWGTAWAGLALSGMFGLRAVGLIPSSLRFIDLLGMALRIGFVGGLVGMAFATYLRFVHRGRRLADLSAVRIGIGIGIATGILVPSLMQLSSLATGGGLVPWGLIDGDIVMVTLFGGIAAGVSVRLAQLASRIVPDEEPTVAIDETEVLSRLGPATDMERYERWERRGDSVR